MSAGWARATIREQRASLPHVSMKSPEVPEICGCLETKRIDGPEVPKLLPSEYGSHPIRPTKSCPTCVPCRVQCKPWAAQLIIPNDTICLKQREAAAELAPSNLPAGNSVCRASKSKMLNQNSIDLSWPSQPERRKPCSYLSLPTTSQHASYGPYIHAIQALAVI